MVPIETAVESEITPTGAGVKGMAGLAELESEKARRERARKAVESREWHPVNKPISEAAPSPKIEPCAPKERVRAAAAKSAGVSERKVI